MVKTLQQIGNSWGVIIDRPVLDLLGITAETPLKVELARDGSRALVITPLEGDEAEAHKARVRESARRVTRMHRETLKKLAE